ncbi:TetR/AcrR family transcriptional regulator [Nocardia sp. NPDC051052]|uniref:TetR/AcrR family transcriptional regulator n=1 Tax=Nocardia sp. NPDC051052 TaxID=3364322 RepID=UPI0037A7F8AA
METRRVRANPGEGGRLREEILAAAEQLLEATGTDEAVTVRAVAKAAGVSTPSVYLHFADREALLEAVCFRVWGQLEELFHRSRVADPFHSLGRFGRAYVKFALAHPVQYRVLLMRTSSSENPAATTCFRLMTEAIATCVDTGLMRGDPGTLALHLWSAAHGCVTLLITQPDLPWPEDLDAFIDNTIRMAGFGVALQSRLPGVRTSPELATALDHLRAD